MKDIINALKNIYTGRLAVYEYIKQQDNEYTHKVVKTLVLDNIPCLLTSMVSRRSVARDLEKFNAINKTNVVKKLFLSNDIDIKLGSLVEVFQDGKKYTFEYTGEIFMYPTHQEIIVESIKIA